MKIVTQTVGIFSLLLLAACDGGPKGSQGFTLPDGNVESGKATYINLQCNACHKMDEVAQLELEGEGEPEISVRLGGRTTRIQTYGQLVTSIINPSHKLARGYPSEMVQDEGESKMRNYNDALTVTELIDLVAFVQSNYVLEPIEPTVYPIYYR